MSGFTKSLTVKKIFEDDFHLVEFASASQSSRGLVYTFTPIGFRNKKSPGFGVKYLTGRGFDVVSFKCITDTWYQDLPNEALISANLSNDYECVASYGSSMGAFASIAFSKILGAKKVIAFGPQYVIGEDYDTRFRQKRKAINNWKHSIESKNSAGKELILIFDPFDRRDLEHILRIRKNVDFESIREFEVPLGGHPTTQFLLETGQLTTVVDHLLDGHYDVTINRSWSRLKNSKTFFLSLSRLAEKKSLNWRFWRREGQPIWVQIAPHVKNI